MSAADLKAAKYLRMGSLSRNGPGAFACAALIGCSSATGTEKGSDAPHDAVDTLISKDGHTDVHALVALIDPIYGTDTRWLGKKKVAGTDDEAFGVVVFDHAEATDLWAGGDFEFLAYGSSAAADSAFKAMEALTAAGTLTNSLDDKEVKRSERARRAFNKGGSTYLLLGNVIMHHRRTCDFSALDESRERAMIDTLFARYPGTRMMQGLCDWGPVRRRPIDPSAAVVGPWNVAVPNALDIRTIRIERDAVIIEDQAGEQRREVVRSIAPSMTNERGIVLQLSDRSLCMYFQPNGIFLDACCDDCPQATVQRAKGE